MKVICKISHETMNSETGGFRRFEAGKTYDVEEPDLMFFDKGTVPIYGLEDEKGKRRIGTVPDKKKEVKNDAD
ncbi:MAG TPA: hypothetical protein VI728_10370 [Syntrophales bacterium]|nr:hypothetical protein [Syntrophales bacterium]